MNVAFQSMKREHRIQKGHTSITLLKVIFGELMIKVLQGSFRKHNYNIKKNKYVILRMVKDTYHPHSSI